ncbi:MAG TPA: 3-phosphoshikimate 1-carboxyvinyltransferase [Chlamydiales bacterium]|nr:3-phosphoshikimate 1-carboxyvinyltransferase [Chlamydiales bacterium]
MNSDKMVSIFPSKLKGKVTIPSSKSHTLRAILFASLANGVSTIEQALDSPDTSAMIQAMRQLGAKIDVRGNLLEIHGFNARPKAADDVIQCGNSGQVLRFVGAIAGLISQYTILTGDDSIRHNRPVLPLLDGLNQLGAQAVSSREDGFAPIIVKGPFTKNQAIIHGEDSQPVSGLLIASAFAHHPIEINVINPGEKPWIEVTLDWFQRLGIAYQASDYTRYQMQGSTKLDAFHYIVPGDFSSAAFPIAAAIITDSELVLDNIDMTDIQGDKAIIPLLQKMGANISFGDRKLIVHRGSTLTGQRIDVSVFVDALPILAVLGCFANGVTEICNGAIARKKESDRITCIRKELQKMGAKIEEKPDGLIIHPSILNGAHLKTHHDHRIALALSVAALGARGESTIHGFECAAKTYPNFIQDIL